MPQSPKGAVVTLPADQILLQRVYVTAAKGSATPTANRTELRLWAEDTTNTNRASKDSHFTPDAK